MLSTVSANVRGLAACALTRSAAGVNETMRRDVKKRTRFGIRPKVYRRGNPENQLGDLPVIVDTV
jgi:hypothetical protein